ncbi:Nucleolar complex protein 3 homolog [Sergentomyia squamirostris]
MGSKKLKISALKRSKHVRVKKNVASNQFKKQMIKTKTDRKEMRSEIFKSRHNNSENGESFKEKNKKCRMRVSYQATVQEDASSDLEDDVTDMINDEDISYLKENFSKKVDKQQDDHKYTESKRKRSSNEDIDYHEKKFRKDYENRVLVGGNRRDLLPIKTKHGILRQSMVIREKDKDSNTASEEDENEKAEGSEVNDSDDEVIQNETESPEVKTENTAISVADLLILREQEIQRQKYRIGIICSGILERPEERITNFTCLFDLMGRASKSGANLVSIRKIAQISALEVFKDIIPEYKLGQVETENIKVKKDTLIRVTFENALLQQYKKYLQILEKTTLIVSKKRPNAEGPLTTVQISLAEVATNCMCELLLAHSNFNFSPNIAQTLVYLSNSRFSQIRERVNACFRTIFKTDKRLELTLHIIRRINHLIKAKQNNVHTDVLTCLTSLQIKDINLDADKEKEIKEKKLEARRSRVMNLSKKEKKRQKKLKELEKELLETKAEENKESRQHKLTEITKLIFNIYFRILKNDPNSKLLSTTLEGLAKFAHVINLEFFSDLVNVLNNIMETIDLDYREQLHCIQTVFVLLSGQGEVLNIDPIRFYNHLYRNLLIIHAGKNHNDFLIILRTLEEVVVKRRKDVTYQRLLAFTKRIMSASLQLMHNGSLGCVCITKNMLQLTSKSVDVLLDTESFVGSGRYDPELIDPEYCNANCTLLYEVSALMRHYHPICAKMAKHLAAGAPISGEGSLSVDIAKLTPEELFGQFDSTSMSFNPAIPPPRKKDAKNAKGNFVFSNDILKAECSSALRNPLRPTATSCVIVDFHGALCKIK